MENEKDHAYVNAQGWAGTIAELVAALECDYDRLEVLRDERQDLIDAVTEAAEAREADPCEETESAHHEAMAAEAEWYEENSEELAELTAAATYEGELQKDNESVRERIQESPLSVEVRSGWYSPTGEAQLPEDFMILLSTGGPALRIRGELSEHCEPQRAWLEYQDWGTPWTEYHGEGCEHETLLTFCQQFYFGE